MLKRELWIRTSGWDLASSLSIGEWVEALRFSVLQFPSLQHGDSKGLPPEMGVTTNDAGKEMLRRAPGSRTSPRHAACHSGGGPCLA